MVRTADCDGPHSDSTRSLLLSVLAALGCGSPTALEIETAPFEKLSQYGLFRVMERLSSRLRE